MNDPQPMFGSPIGPWHTVFAWLPLRTYDGRWVWLRKVQRRRIQIHEYLYCPHTGAWFWWQYRSLGEAAA